MFGHGSDGIRNPWSTICHTILVGNRILRGRNPLLKIEPDAAIVAAVVSAASGRTLVVDGAVFICTVIMDTVAVWLLPNHIRSGIIPLDNALV